MVLRVTPNNFYGIGGILLALGIALVFLTNEAFYTTAECGDRHYWWKVTLEVFRWLSVLLTISVVVVWSMFSRNQNVALAAPLTLLITAFILGLALLGGNTMVRFWRCYKLNDFSRYAANVAGDVLMLLGAGGGFYYLAKVQ